MALLWCSALLVALGGCPAAQTPAPPLLARVSAPVAPAPADPAAGQRQPRSRDPTPGFGWPLVPEPAVVRPFDAPTAPWAPGHRGVDLRAAVGQQVRAAGAGRVAYSGVIAGRGVVSVEHPGGWRTTYEPLDSRLPVGTVVAPGTALGTLSPTASHCSPASCLHWGLLVAPDSYRDPLVLVSGARRVILLPVP